MLQAVVIYRMGLYRDSLIKPLKSFIILLAEVASGRKPVRLLLQSPWEQHGSNTSHAASSTGLPQEAPMPSGTTSAAIAPTAVTHAPSRAAGHAQVVGDAQTSEVPLGNTNTPVFNFGNPEWSDFLQANETLDSNAQLPPQLDNMDPYVGFDIPFWLGQDQYWDMLHDRT
ncbi:hypothetical protein E8E13_003116 [Curvularia kusanoi]|uniref:Uncharacterized protein n=1 Tax=Curvularia kusanoi TaxID=90978 RepID=A0A9P4WAR6_CURKU|nr:hypothetical protein E8E13_003116 [Curvularia kusanoi]